MEIINSEKYLYTLKYLFFYKFYMTKFLVDTTENLPLGSLKNITAGGKEILIANVKGNYYAINNVCNHAGAELHEGAILNDKELICPWHSAKWNVETGELIWFPQKLKNQETYQIVIENNNVYVEI
jgi:3-phenylpropionate/trans-cinnamate dioxygenase ferredoxin component